MARTAPIEMVAPGLSTVGASGRGILLRPELAIVAVCVTLLMITGNFDLSVGAIVGFSAYGALYAIRSGYSSEVATLFGLLCGVSIGLINGLLVVTTRLHSFIVTMGTMLV